MQANAVSGIFFVTKSQWPMLKSHAHAMLMFFMMLSACLSLLILAV